MKLHKHIWLVLGMAIIILLSGCQWRKSNAPDRMVEQLNNQQDELDHPAVLHEVLEQFTGQSVNLEQVEEIESILNCENDRNGCSEDKGCNHCLVEDHAKDYAGVHPTIWKAYKETLDVMADDLPIHDVTLAKEHGEAYQRVLLYFDDLSNGYKENHSEHDVIFDLIRVDDITEEFIETYKDEDFCHQDARYYRLHFVVLGINHEGHLVHQGLHSLEKGAEIEVICIDGAWQASPVR